MKQPIVSESVVLNFDPKTIDEPLVREIFESKTARTIYLGVKASHHLINQYFNANCLRLAEWIDSDKLLEGGDGSRSFMSRRLTGWLRDLGMIGYSETYGQDLLPFVLGELEINYDVCLECNQE